MVKKKFIVILTVDVESEEDNTPEGLKDDIDSIFGHDVSVDSVIRTDFDGDAELLNVRIIGAVIEEDSKTNEKVLAFDNRTIVITSKDIEEELN